MMQNLDLITTNPSGKDMPPGSPMLPVGGIESDNTSKKQQFSSFLAGLDSHEAVKQAPATASDPLVNAEMDIPETAIDVLVDVETDLAASEAEWHEDAPAAASTVLTEETVANAKTASGLTALTHAIQADKPMAAGISATDKAGNTPADTDSPDAEIEHDPLAGTRQVAKPEQQSRPTSGVRPAVVNENRSIETVRTEGPVVNTPDTDPYQSNTLNTQAAPVSETRLRYSKGPGTVQSTAAMTAGTTETESIAGKQALPGVANMQAQTAMDSNEAGRDASLPNQAGNHAKNESALTSSTRNEPAASIKTTESMLDTGRQATVASSLSASGSVAMESGVQLAAAEPVKTESSVLQSALQAAAPPSSMSATTPAATATGSPKEFTGLQSLPSPLQSTYTAGSAGWEREISGQIRWLGQQDISRAEILLKPADLGSIEIRIISNDDQTTVNFVTSSNAAREVIESSLPRLREMLANQGLNLADTNVSQQDDSSQQMQDSKPHFGNAAPGLTGPVAEQDISVTREGMTVSRDDGQIDFYV